MKPNVLLLITDQQSRLAQAAAGNRQVYTPNLDSLSAAGVRFTRSYCAAPVCGPSRSSLATGRAPHETGMVTNPMPWPTHLPDLCGIFLGAGYDVGWAGRWPAEVPRNEGAGPRLEPLLPSNFRARLGVESDAVIADAAIEFIRRSHERPFFLGVPLINPHDICYWVMGQTGDTADPGAPLPPLPHNFPPLEPEPEFVRRCREREHYGPENTFARDWGDVEWRQYLREYYALVERVDGELGRILGELADAGLAEDTVVVATADHGEGMAHHRWLVKLMLWESVVSVPLTIAWPGGVPAGAVADELATGLDVLPTLCDLAGIEAPGKTTGRSLRPALEGTSGLDCDYIVVELHPDTEDLDLSARIVVSRRYKYAAFSDGTSPELLFDLVRDPGETRNLAEDPESVQTLAEHRAYLAEWAAETSDTLWH